MNAASSPRRDVSSLSLHDMPLDYPFDLHWTAQDLADAVVIPLHAIDDTPPANDARAHRPRPHRLFRYANTAPQSRFRVG